MSAGMRKRVGWGSGSLVALMLFTSPLMAEDSFYAVPINDLNITKGTIPNTPHPYESGNYQLWTQMVPYAVLDGEGEVYLGENIGAWRGDTPRQFRGRRFGGRIVRDEDAVGERPATDNLVTVRAPKGQKVTGIVYFPKTDLSGMVGVKFQINPAAADESAREKFYYCKEDYYAWKQSSGDPGAAWYRYQKQLAVSKRTGKTIMESIQPAEGNPNPRRNRNEYEDTFQIFSGGRAISENLQLDRLLRNTKPGEPTVKLSTLTGITVAEMDWDEHIKDVNPKLDTLAEFIPADQHALFFRSFKGMIAMIDEGNANGTPILFMVSQRAEDTGVQERYQKQMCVDLDSVTRTLGPSLVKSVAITGSDPYLRTGTDVGILMDCRQVGPMKNYVMGKQNAAVQARTDAQMVQGKVAGVNYNGAVSPDRSLSSYVASVGNTLMITNSLAQMEILIKANNDQESTLSALPEYTFFRNRYPLTNKKETCLLVVTDATIRRWCGPKWRIAASRRTRAAAIMSHLQAEHLTALVENRGQNQLLNTNLYVPDLGTLKLASTSVTSSEYGTTEFLTPIREMDFDTVTPAEAESYRRWRNQYQSYWRQFFDPIAVSISLDQGEISADTTVMPLIQRSDYREFIEIAGDAKIKPKAGDRHPEALMHAALAVDHDGRMFRQGTNFLQGILPGVRGNPLGWMGETASFYVDKDAFWKELAKADLKTPKDREEFIEKNVHRLPVAVTFEVKNSLKLSLFLTALRGFIQQVSPDLITWETKKHGEKSYVKMTPAEAGRQQGVPEGFAIYYVATPRLLLFTLNEDLLKRAMDRDAQIVKEEVDPAKNAAPYLGESMTFQIDQMALGMFEAVFGGDYQRQMQRQAWANIAILNEWKRQFPKEDPMKVHQKFWQTKLLCPGGGGYVWNDEYQTMESTLYGHPGQPKNGPRFPSALQQAKHINFGVTFENEGLRAKVQMQRNSKQKAKTAQQ